MPTNKQHERTPKLQRQVSRNAESCASRHTAHDPVPRPQLLKPTRPRQIATHRNPDADVLVAAWLAESFLFAGEPTEIVFVARTYRPGDAATYDCVVDVGSACDPARLWFAHKPPAFADRHQNCAARLVWE
jgi:hypothetical protein